MDLLEEPDIVKLRDVYGSHRIQTINEIHRIADVIRMCYLYYYLHIYLYIQIVFYLSSYLTF